MNAVDQQPAIPESLFQAIYVELQRHPAGIKEYDLLQCLRAYGFFRKDDAGALSTHEIFENHFILYHALYALREKLARRDEAWIEIYVLNIQLRPLRKGGDKLMIRDNMREYYLDWSNLRNTTAHDVDNMISSFWTRFSAYQNRGQALAELGLSDPVSDEKIKQTYRKLVMQYHPDRGGSNERLQQLNAAIHSLLKDC